MADHAHYHLAVDHLVLLAIGVRLVWWAFAFLGAWLGKSSNATIHALGTSVGGFFEGTKA